MTSLVDCLDYIVQGVKVTIKGTASSAPPGTGNTRFEETLFPPKSTKSEV
jgi:hypothetical protein